LPTLYKNNAQPHLKSKMRARLLSGLSCGQSRSPARTVFIRDVVKHLRKTMASIDRADWHYGGDYPKDLPIENGGTHIGMYLTWIINNDLIGQTHIENSKSEIEKVKKREKTGRDFLFSECDEKLWEEDFNEEGLKFTEFYYQSSDPEESYGQYLDDYLDEFDDIDCESLYEIPNTWENYDRLSKVLDKRYSKWKNGGNKKSWKFWK